MTTLIAHLPAALLAGLLTFAPDAPAASAPAAGDCFIQVPVEPRARPMPRKRPAPGATAKAKAATVTVTTAATAAAADPASATEPRTAGVTTAPAARVRAGTSAAKPRPRPVAKDPSGAAPGPQATATARARPATPALDATNRSSVAMRKVPVDCAPTPVREQTVRAVLPDPAQAPQASVVAPRRSLVETAAEPAPAHVPSARVAGTLERDPPADAGEPAQAWASEWMTRLMAGPTASSPAWARYEERSGRPDERPSAVGGDAIVRAFDPAAAVLASIVGRDPASPGEGFGDDGPGGGGSGFGGSGSDGSGSGGGSAGSDDSASTPPGAQVPLPGSASLVAIGCLGWLGWAGVGRRGAAQRTLRRAACAPARSAI